MYSSLVSIFIISRLYVKRLSTPAAATRSWIDNLEETKRVEFFYFVTDDPKFLPLSKLNNDFKMLEFLQQKLEKFKSQIEND